MIIANSVKLDKLIINQNLSSIGRITQIEGFLSELACINRLVGYRLNTVCSKYACVAQRYTTNRII